ncbi:hypothetical protein [Rickettsia endosymbiont of Polydrusus tereticollis]|uniref:hypothetical protein n=1 Tax=Rickettsia endosymbiont of Polydrusus tereticollis TaxID=3066251 RepID=UPI0031330F97
MLDFFSYGLARVVRSATGATSDIAVYIADNITKYINDLVGEQPQDSNNFTIREEKDWLVVDVEPIGDTTSPQNNQ